MTWEGKIINRYLRGNEGQVREQTQVPKAWCSLATLLSAGKQSRYDSPERRKDSPDPRPHKEMTSVPSMAGKSFLGRGCQETKNSPINATVTFHYRPITHWFPNGGVRGKLHSRQDRRPPPGPAQAEEKPERTEEEDS